MSRRTIPKQPRQPILGPEEIRRRREERGLSNRDLADEMAITLGSMGLTAKVYSDSAICNWQREGREPNEAPGQLASDVLRRTFARLEALAAAAK